MATLPRTRVAAALFERAATSLAGGGWRVDLVRFERRHAFAAEGGRWVASSLLACVERPARGGSPAALLLNAHVHLWPPHLTPAGLRRAGEAEWLLAEVERFAARGWGVSWDPANGRFAWLARPLGGDLGPLLAERDLLETAFGAAPGRPVRGAPAGPASMAGAIAAFGDSWIPSALGLSRLAVPVPAVGGTIDLEMRLLGPPAERRSSSRPLRVEAGITRWLPEAAGASARVHRRIPGAGGIRELRRLQRLLDRLAGGG